MKVLLDIDDSMLEIAGKVSKLRRQSRKAYLEEIIYWAMEAASSNQDQAHTEAGKQIKEAALSNASNQQDRTKEPAEGTNAFYLKYGAFYHKDLK